MEFKDILRQLREEKGISGKKLSATLQFSPNLVYAWERGRAQPNIETLIELSNFFDVSVDYLVGKADEETTGATFQCQTAQSTNVATMGATLSEKETELLQAFNALGIFEQDSILVQIKALAEKKQAIKK